jgi:hypothetical protein
MITAVATVQPSGGFFVPVHFTQTRGFRPMSTAAATPIDRPLTLKQFIGNAGLRFYNRVIQLARETGLLTDARLAVRAAAPFAEDELPALFGDADSAERVLRWQKQMEEMLTVEGVADPLEFQMSEVTDHIMDNKRPVRLQVLTNHNGAIFKIQHRLLLTALKLAGVRMDDMTAKACRTAAMCEVVGLFRTGETQPFAVIAPLEN